jgi:hypothetical protein
MNVPAWLSTAGVAALVSGVFLVAGTWVNGWRQRAFEERLRHIQMEHERQVQFRNDQRQLRDLKLSRVRASLGNLSAISVRIRNEIERLYLLMTEDSTGFWDRELRNVSARAAGTRKEIEEAIAVLVLDIEATQLIEIANLLLRELNRLEIQLIDVTLLDGTPVPEASVHQATQTLIDQQSTLSNLVAKVTAEARSMIEALERPLA